MYSSLCVHVYVCICVKGRGKKIEGEFMNMLESKDVLMRIRTPHKWVSRSSLIIYLFMKCEMFRYYPMQHCNFARQNINPDII